MNIRFEGSTVVHAKVTGQRQALCGTQPRRALSYRFETANAVTCKRCRALVKESGK